MMFFKKKIKKVIERFYNWDIFSDAQQGVSISEPLTLAQQRLAGEANDVGAGRGIRLYNEHKVKLKNQWINPITSINTGYGSAQYAYYNYQEVNYWDCYALAQDPLFNKIFNILSKTPFANDGMVSDDLSEKDRETLQEGLIKFQVKDKLEEGIRSSFVAGGCLVYMDFGLDNLEEPLDLEKIDMRQFKGFRHIDPINITAVDVNTVAPADKDYMNPKKWYVIGLGTCDRSHFLKFEQNEPEMVLKPMCMYFGMPLTQLIKQDVANSNMASQGLANLMNRFRNLYLKTDSSNFTGQGAPLFKRRLEVMSMFQDNHSIYPLENTEEIMQFVTPVTGMSDACEFFYQIIASKTDITLSILLGKGAQGLSGTLEGERKNFYDRIRSIQSYVKPNLLKMYGIVYGYMTDGKFKTFLDYNFNPLEQSSEKEKAENLTKYVDVADKFLNMGVPADDVMDWLKTHKDLNLENMTIEEKPENYEMGADELGDEQQGFGGQEEAQGGEKQEDREQRISNEDNIDWITVKGVHIPIMKGQSQGDAIKEFFKEKGYQSGGYGKAIKTNKSFAEVIDRVGASNKRDIKQDDVVKEFISENKGISKDAIEKAIKKAEEYREKKSFVNDKGEKQYIDTQSIYTYKDKSGNLLYTKEREQLHKQILNKIMANAKNAKPENGEAPTFTILGGRGGSGKSKLEGLAYDPAKVIRLDADEIKGMLPEYKGHNAWEVHEESSDIVKRALSIAKQKGLNVVLDGTMSGFKSAEKKIKDFEGAGYNIDGFYMHLPREVSAKRGLGRFMGKDGTGSGRYVPLNVMLGMKDNEANFQKLLPHFRKWAMWDNNVKRGEEPKLVQKSWK